MCHFTEVQSFSEFRGIKCRPLGDHWVDSDVTHTCQSFLFTCLPCLIVKYHRPALKTKTNMGAVLRFSKTQDVMQVLGQRRCRTEGSILHQWEVDVAMGCSTGFPQLSPLQPFIIAALLSSSSLTPHLSPNLSPLPSPSVLHNILPLALLCLLLSSPVSSPSLLSPPLSFPFLSAPLPIPPPLLLQPVIQVACSSFVLTCM